MPDDAKQGLTRLLAARAIPLIENNIHGELYHGGCAPAERSQGLRSRRLVMLCHSFSKDISHSFRVGWIAHGRFLPHIQRLKLATPLSTPLLPQLAIAKFVESGGYERHLRCIRRAYAAKVAAMIEAVERYFLAGTRVTSPAGGHILWLQLPEGVDSLRLYKEALPPGITVAPGFLFGSTPERYRNFIRLNAAYMSD
jgi:DNA-binding transcriptional MocR family regulator